MAICPFYQRGTCKFGDRCKNEHPGSQRDGGNAFGGGNRSGFNAFGGGGDRYRPSGGGGGGAFGEYIQCNAVLYLCLIWPSLILPPGNRTGTPRYTLSKDEIKTDLTDQRPAYPFSCYGAGRDAPRQLMEGPLEISPEELRARYYTQRSSGNEAAGQHEEAQLYSKAEEQVKSILSDLDGAIKYVEDGADVHPNRLDIAQGKVDPSSSTAAPAPSNANPFSSAAAASPFARSQVPSSASGNPFGGGTQSQTSTFGKPANPFGQSSAPGQSNSAFGQASALGAGAGSGFGKPSMPGSGSAFAQTSASGGGPAFGKPSAFGGGSAFGQTSALGQPSAFGQPSAPGTASAFGQPSAPGASSAFGQPSQPGQTAAFGQPSQPGQTSAFGQPSQPGQTSAFGQPSQPSQTSAFGQSSAPGQTSAFGKPAFGQSTFGQTSQAGAVANPFGQAAQAGQAQPASNPFGSTQTQTSPAPANPFGSAPAQQKSAFGQPGGLAKPSPFAPAAQNTTTTMPKPNPFAAATQTTTPAAPAFGAPSQPANPFAQAATQQAPSQATQPPGAAGAADPFKEGRPEDYEGEQGRKLQQIYQRVAQMGIFNPNEYIPLVPPKSEWVVAL
ncbi:uncharacterized protein N0V89_009833 [Didymosphaeria variabile]|uniref:C3H1-type domain-containing protein n=1 Tax=Didymosphaeria variabile TaxID=1932322 RepID=A0A9W8XFV8_9PLEO|nr:uncharacterized protein N0V89_009833 [Didymosphaeria variabile]KAJ4348459.1 hypothetical protein N0V89_009833 [Didymosphaeria variabile]